MKLLGREGVLPAALFVLVGCSRAQMLDRNCFGSEENGTLSDTFLASPVNEESQAVVYAGERAFSVNLIKALFKKFESNAIDQNIFISPSSIYHTLMLAYFGAHGETQSELAKGLGFENLTKSEVLKTYMFDRAFQAVRERTVKGYNFTHANKLYFEEDLMLNGCLRLVLADQIELIDFKNSPEKSRNKINSWVEEVTKGNIRDLVPEGHVDKSTRAAIVNAAYFKGNWESQFKQENTTDGIFYVKQNQTRIIPFMTQKGSFSYYPSEALQSHFVELPYQGDHVSMIIILPPFYDDGLQQIVERMDAKLLQSELAEINSGFYKMDRLKVTIPKFSVRGSLELQEPLADLNMTRLFGPNSNLTGFIDTKFTSPEKAEEVRLSGAVHKAFIDVDEEGSEAAAATALLGFRSARPVTHTEFVANHPFLFLIYDKQLDSILFFGVYQHPASRTP